MVLIDPALKNPWILDQLDALTLEQKIGQMLTTGVPGDRLTPEVAALARRCHLGGVMLWEANIGSGISGLEQTAAFIADLQRLSAADSGLPLFVSIDHEGGAVERLKYPATALPSAMALGATRSLDHVRASTRVIATEVRTLGINVDYAPVLDVNSESSNPVIGIRAFGDSPDLVATMGSAVINTLADHGIVATAKHFPGHGGATVDSHLDLPTIHHDRAQMEAIDLIPFQAAIDNGVDMIMSAHAVYPALADAYRPATMSQRIMTALLRQTMGFQGLIITDALVMRAIAERYTLAEAAVMSVQAGADIVLTLTTLEEQVRVFDRLLCAVRQGEISAERIDDSVARILSVKSRLLSKTQYGEPAGPNNANWPTEKHQSIAREIARDAITMVRNDERLLPLRLLENERLGLIEFAGARFSPVEDDVCGDGALARLFRERHTNTSYLCLDSSPGDAAFALEHFVQDSDILIVATRNAHLVRGQGAMVERILRGGKPVVIVALRNPYDIMAYPAATSYVISYGDSLTSLEAVVALLFGDSEPKGKLPVTIPGLFAYGHGLDHF